jgi:hypothetical protein
MVNLTIALDDALLAAARAKAAREGTSVNEVCRVAIERFAEREESVQRMLTSFARLAALPAQAVGWAGRDALYAEALSERGLLKAAQPLQE